MPDEQQDATSTDLVSLRVAKAVEVLKGGSFKWDDVLKAIGAPEEDLEAAGAPPPTLVPITKEQTKALESLPQVFGSVVPDTPRSLTPVEVERLYAEVEVLDTISKMADTRKANIRRTVYNHFDAKVRQEHEDAVKQTEGDPPKLPPVDDKGHFVTDDEVPIPGTDKAWTREVRQGAAVLDLNALQALAKDEAVTKFDHSDYLAMTTQVRQFDEAKAKKLIKERPELLSILARATTRKRRTTALNLRKAGRG
jgi:hypothetical protein